MTTKSGVCKIAGRRSIFMPAITRAGHTMGDRLGDYVLPKVPIAMLFEGFEGKGRAEVYGNQSLGLLTGGAKRDGKRFNWRRPFFTYRHGLLHCVAAPGRDYIYHYGRLVATACGLAGLSPDIGMQPPAPDAAVEFVRRWLPTELPTVDVMVLGYVERLFTDSISAWSCQPGFGWKTSTVGRARVGLLGCEFSYWGDLAGAVVTVLAERKRTSWVVYAGKLGTLTAGIVPNVFVATGTTSFVEGRQVVWQSRLNLESPDAMLLTGQTHITVPSTLDETREWYEENVSRFDVVDPEIGRMAVAANDAGVKFDYLHIISDNLCGHYAEGLYDERVRDVTIKRQRCLVMIESVLRRSFA